MEKKKQTIYLAGKVNGPKWDIATACEDLASFVASDGNGRAKWDAHYNPGDHCRWSEYHRVFGAPEMREQVTQFAIWPLNSCDRLIAYLDRPDSFGSIAEIAWAASQMKLCFVLLRCPDPTPDTPEELAHSLMFDAYWFVTSLPGVTVVRVSSLQHAIAEVHNYLAPESPMETKLLDALLLRGVRPTCQYRVERYRLDYAFPDRKVGIEVDGHAYHSSKIQRTRDAQRDRFLTALGWRILRFTGTEINQNPEACALEIVNTLSAI